MRKLRALWLRLLGLFARSRAAVDFDAELESHLQLHIDDNLRAGMAPEEARRQALLHLGGLEQTRQAHRDRRSLSLLDNLIQDIRFGCRMIARNAGFAVVPILTLAIGIGATTTAFNWIDLVLLRPSAWVKPATRNPPPTAWEAPGSPHSK